jgi:hypothetical protein
MNVEPDTPVVKGARTRYRCGSVADVDAHLAYVTGWLAENLPQLKGSQRRTAEINGARDIDRLLNARTMLAALTTLDGEVGPLHPYTPIYPAVPPRRRDVTAG